jgi:DNA-binding NtrC family response regulator
MAVLAPGPVLDLPHLPPEVRGPAPAAASAGGEAGYPADLPLAEVDRLHTLRVLDRCGGNRTRAAEVLGITVRTLYNRLDAYRRAGG